MQYYKAKVITTETTTKRFVQNELMTVFSYGEVDGFEYFGVETEYLPEDVLAFQPVECEVENIEYSELVNVAVNSAIAKGVDDLVRNRIHERIPNADEEAKLINRGIQDKNDPLYVEYRTYVDSCVAWGRGLKALMGIQ